MFHADLDHQLDLGAVYCSNAFLEQPQIGSGTFDIQWTVEVSGVEN